MWSVMWFACALIIPWQQFVVFEVPVLVARGGWTPMMGGGMPLVG